MYHNYLDIIFCFYAAKPDKEINITSSNQTCVQVFYWVFLYIEDCEVISLKIVFQGKREGRKSLWSN